MPMKKPWRFKNVQITVAYIQEKVRPALTRAGEGKGEEEAAGRVPCGVIYIVCYNLLLTQI